MSARGVRPARVPREPAAAPGVALTLTLTVTLAAALTLTLTLTLTLPLTLTLTPTQVRCERHGRQVPTALRVHRVDQQPLHRR